MLTFIYRHAAGQHKIVSFGDPVVTTIVHFSKREPAAAISKTDCADSDTSTNLNRRSTTRDVGLSNIGLPNTKVMVADGHVKEAQEKKIKS